MTIAKEDLFFKLAFPKKENHSKMKCVGRRSVEHVNCIIGRARNLFIHTKVHTVKCLAKIAPYVIEII